MQRENGARRMVQVWPASSVKPDDAMKRYVDKVGALMKSHR